LAIAVFSACSRSGVTELPRANWSR
jgi:hypothetical protein